jgi:hypothetical protein
MATPWTSYSADLWTCGLWHQASGSGQQGSACNSASLYCNFPDSLQLCPIIPCFRNHIQGIIHPVLHTVPFLPPPFLRVPDFSRVHDTHPAGSSPGLLLPSCCSSYTSKVLLSIQSGSLSSQPFSLDSFPGPNQDCIKVAMGPSDPLWICLCLPPYRLLQPKNSPPTSAL